MRSCLHIVAMMLLAFMTGPACTGGALKMDPKSDEAPDSETLMTVLGPRDFDEAAVILPHEHLLVDFVGAEQAGPHRYDAEEAFDVILPYLIKARELGVGVLVECTPSYIGKDPALLKRLSTASGVSLLTNTGYYAAADRRFLPHHAYQETAEQLAGRWIRDWRHGIGDTGVRPGFIKIGVDGAPLPDVSLKIIEAAAMAQRETGLTVAMHAPDGRALLEAEPVLNRHGVPPERFIWVHANAHPGIDMQIAMAGKGFWVEFDGLSPDSLERHLELVTALRDQGLLDRVLLSHDAGWYSPGEPLGGDFRFFGDLTELFVPMLREHGFSDLEIDKLVHGNPLRAFAVAQQDM